MTQFKTLTTTGFRNLKDEQKLYFNQELNFIFGENGAGKSNLLEAIHFFSHTRSFRGAQIEQIIKKGENQFTLFAEIQKEKQKPLDKLGIQRNLMAEVLLRVNQQKVPKYSDLASQIAVKTLSSEKNNLLDLSPKFRRQEIDWQLFHMKHQNLVLFNELANTLKQKNALLKNQRLSPIKLASALEPWNHKLAELTFKINKKRNDALSEVNPELKALIKLQAIDKIEGVNIELTSGVPKSIDWQDSNQTFAFLSQNWDKERRAAQALYGPQRADLHFFKGEKKEHLAKDFYSRGEKKLISLYFSLAQVNVLKKYGHRAVLSLDDLHAELSTKNFNRFIKLLYSQEFQCFITAPIKSFSEMKKYGKTYQVQFGEVREI